MRSGLLSDYFRQIAWKHLTAVDADQHRSHQHEFGGVGKLRELLGDDDRRNIPTTFIYLADDDPEPLRDQAWLSWYDTRRRQSSRGPEYRLYFPDTVVSNNATQGDLLIIGVRPDDTLMAIIAESGSTIASQLLWLFGVTDVPHPGFSVKGEIETNQQRLEFASRFILEELGVEVQDTDDNFLDQMLNRFGPAFPAPCDFSAYARESLGNVDLICDPDSAIMTLMEREEILFRTMEQHIIGNRLQAGVGETEDFNSFSLSVQQRRKSRVDGALECHLRYLLGLTGISSDLVPGTINPSSSYLLFPSLFHYRDHSLAPDLLTVLGFRSNYREEWRQSFPDRSRTAIRHIFTLEPSLSSSQTDEMREHDLQLVLPARLHSSYTREQRAWIMTLATLFEQLKAKQSRLGASAGIF